MELAVHRVQKCWTFKVCYESDSYLTKIKHKFLQVHILNLYTGMLHRLLV
jgi:hypothetical protein